MLCIKSGSNNISLMFIWFLALPSALHADGGGQPDCQVKALTENCDLFKEKGREDGIKFADGSFIPNPQKRAAQRSEFSENARNAELRAQAAVMRAFQNLRNPEVSPLFLVAINGNLKNPVLVSSLDQQVSEKHHESEPLILPWPPTDDSAQLRKVNVNELRAFFATLKASDRAEITRTLLAAKQVSPTSVNENSSGIMSAGFLEKRKKRARELFDEAQSLLLDEIQKGRSFENLPEFEKAQYLKVKSVRLKDFDAAKSDPSCAGVNPDAFYAPRNQTITLCEKYALWPDASLIEVLGHELGHAIDPCNQQFPVVALNKGQLSALSKNESELPDEIRKNPDRLELLRALKSDSRSSTINFSAFMTDGKGSEAFGYLKNKGYFEVLAEGIPFKSSPASRAYACLIREVGIRKLSDIQIEIISADYVRSLEETSSLKQRKKVQSDASAKLKRYPQCIRPSQGKTQVQEAMSDLWSAKVLGRWLTKYPPKTREEKAAALATFTTDYCSVAGKPLRNVGDANQFDIVSLAERSAESSHPFSRLRADRIHLTEPRIQRALGCRDMKYASCTKFIGTQGSLAPGQRAPSPSKPEAVK